MRVVNSQDYERAAEMREARRRELDLCRCAWPAVVLRNGSGHNSNCPAHLDFVTRRDALIGPEKDSDEP